MSDEAVSVTLLPCPWCPQSTMVVNFDKPYMWVECSRCFTQGPVAATPIEARERWNRRSLTASAADYDSLRARLEESERRANYLSVERERLCCQNDAMLSHLVSLAYAIPPAPFKAEDGKTYKFVPPDPLLYLDQLSRAYHAIQNDPDVRPTLDRIFTLTRDLDSIRQRVARMIPFRIQLRPLLTKGMFAKDDQGFVILISSEQDRHEQVTTLWHEVLHMVLLAAGKQAPHDEEWIERAAVQLARACPDIDLPPVAKDVP